MESFVVSALKYRPKEFSEVVGQESITNTLENAIAHNRLASALLFSGPRGVGKTTCARILARKINEQSLGSEGQTDFSFNIFELDAASNNSVDDIRSLIEQVRIPPRVGTHKVYIVDEVHMLSTAAFNAFLKTLEEPPKHAVFILATTEKHKILPTILSRCQSYDFKRIGTKEIAAHLRKISTDQGVHAEDGALHLIAQKADGGLRDALSMFDRLVSFSGNELTTDKVSQHLNLLDFTSYHKLTEAIIQRQTRSLLLQLNEFIEAGFDEQLIIAGLGAYFRNLLVAQNEDTLALIDDSEQCIPLYREQASRCTESFLLSGIELCTKADANYKNANNKRLLIELCVLQIASFTEAEKKKSQLIPIDEVDRATSPEVIIQQVEIVPKSEGVSGLSLAAIQKKKEAKQRAQKETAAHKETRETPTDLESIEVYWMQYVVLLENQGKKILAANLQIGSLRLENGTELINTVPNDTIRREIENEKEELVRFLRDKTKNDLIGLSLLVEETTDTSNYLYTQEEKLAFLIEKYPSVSYLKQLFSLDL
ncbi:MAG: DNA polymerase III subunit gamma/tau [Bacteroidetes bacterium]|nr:DNA polymerase III subunit gamma/tau [Bacteroidota bacterium]